MYNYDFKNKKIVLELVNVLVSIDDKDLILNIIITNHDLLLFKNIKLNTVISGRGIYEMPEYELVFNAKLNDIKFKIDDLNTLIKYGDKEVILFNFDLNKVIN